MNSTQVEPTALRLARHASTLQPRPQDESLAARSLTDTVAVMLAARDHPLLAVTTSLTTAGRWAAAAHVLDFDDLHMTSTTHISAVCVPTVLAMGGDERAYLAGASVMAHLGNRLGWSHYRAGWHATCTAGAPAAAVAAAVAMRLDTDHIATAIALSVPAAGGVQRAFGTDAKSLQVAFAVESGIRAARLAAAGAHADLRALDAWLKLVNATDHTGNAGESQDPAAAATRLDGSRHDARDCPAAVPDGLAIKLYPCCYALQRPIEAIRGVRASVTASDVTRVVVTTPEAATAPLIHHRPQTGLEAKFSLEYAIATSLLDDRPGFDSFSDVAVQREEAQRLLRTVEVHSNPGGSTLLDGTFDAVLESCGAPVVRCTLKYPPGSPQNPPQTHHLAAKVDDCVRGLQLTSDTWTWAGAATALRAHLDDAARGAQTVGAHAARD